MSVPFRTQVAIVGGGIAGVWLLNALSNKGYQALLLEQKHLGCGQTLASQGMIHGGIKYALGGFTTPSSESIAGMPDRWNQCIAGRGSVDLSNVKILSRDYYLFSDHSISSRVTAFFGSQSIRGRVSRLKRKDFPACFDNAAFKGVVYRLQDLVLDTASLLAELARQWPGRLLRSRADVIAGASGEVRTLALDKGELVADVYVFCAGAGNAELVRNISLAGIGMQRRPLHQVMVKAPGLPELYAHAVSATSGAKPRVTFTSHEARDGQRLWYLGGNLAETGVSRTEAEQLSFAQQELRDLFPWFDWRDATWRSFRVDRAEPLQRDHSRPDMPFCKRDANAILCWPTKLSLTPLLADEVIKALHDLPAGGLAEELPPLPAPTIGLAPWESVF